MMLYDLYWYLSNLPRWHIFAVFIVGYLVYYFIEVVKRPILAISDGPFKKYLLKNVPTLEMKFWPTIWCVEGRAQSVIASIWRQQTLPPLKYRREVLTMKDGGEVAIDWMDNDLPENAPLILILPGLTGESQSEYIKCLVLAGNNIGARVVVFNNRGLGGLVLKTPRLYCAANVDDLSEVLQHISKTYPDSKIGATGISMGGLVLGNYLALYKEDASKIFTACKIISVPWDVHKGTMSIEKPFLNSMLGKHLTNNLCATLSRFEILTTSVGDDGMTQILKSRTIKEFDTHFTSKHFGYESVEHYYNVATLHNKLHHIKVPLLCLSAADDPFQPLEAIPIEAAEKSSHVAIVVTARGGHIGFLDGFWPNAHDEYMARLFGQYFAATLFDDEFHLTTIKDMNTNIQSVSYKNSVIIE